MRPGDTILVVGASGGMGSATLDLARAMGVRTIATTRSAGKEAFLLARGASKVIVLSDLKAAVNEIRSVCDGLGMDGAIEYSGDPTMLRLCVDVLRPGGSVVPLAGEETGAPMPISVTDCTRLELNLLGGRGSNISDQRAILRLLAQQTIKPAVARIMKLSKIREAHAALEAGNVLGRIVIEPWE